MIRGKEGQSAIVLIIWKGCNKYVAIRENRRVLIAKNEAQPIIIIKKVHSNS